MREDRHINIEGDTQGNTIISGDRNRVTITIIQQANRVVEVETPSPEVSAFGPNPYVGLSAFQEQEADRFFGRERLIDQLWETFRNLYTPAPGSEPLRLLPILGPSGSGKSSLTRAGLIPELGRRSLPGMRSARVAVLTPGAHPLEALGRILARVSTPEDNNPVAKTREFTKELHMTRYNGLRRIADGLPDIHMSPLIVLIDQFEEVYTLCEDIKGRTIFIENLLNAVIDRSGHVSVILTLRSDFLGDTQRHSALNQAIARHKQATIVPMMSEEELRLAISKPAEQAGHPLDAATIELLIDQTKGREGVLPLLQFALTRIWEGMGRNIEPAETLKNIGGVGGALAQEAENLYAKLSDTDRQVARRAFLKLIQLGEGSRDTRRRVSVRDIVAHGESEKQVYAVLRSFSRPDTRLITLSEEAGQTTAEVTHEALLENWSTLKEWLTRSRDDVRFERRLTDAAKHWDTQGRPDGLLWRSPDLDLLRNFYQRAAQDMTAVQHAFFETSERKQLQTKRQKWIIGAVLVLFLLILGIGTYIANQVNKQKNEALREQSLSLADASHDQIQIQDPVDGILLALKALPNPLEPDRPYVPEAETELYNAVSTSNKLMVLAGHSDDVLHSVFSPDGQKVITASRDGSARLWDAKTGQLLHVLLGHTYGVIHVDFSPDGQQVLTTSYDDTARLWDVDTGKHLAVLKHDNNVWHASFSPDGQRVVTASTEDARVWDVHTGRLLAVLATHEHIVWHAVFSPDGRLIATASADATARIWDANTGEQLIILEGHEDSIRNAAFSPDGYYLVTASALDETCRLWSVKTGEEISLLKMEESTETSSWKKIRARAIFSPDGRFIATLGNTTAQIWEPSTGKKLNVLQGHEDRITYIDFSPDGQMIVTSSDDGTVRLWSSKTGEQLGNVKYEYSSISQIAFSPDGQRIVISSFDNTARIWSIYAGKQLIGLRGHKISVDRAIFSPDGRYVLTISGKNWNWKNKRWEYENENVRLWDVNTGRQLAGLDHDNPVSYAEFNPDGSLILTASGDAVYLWDIKTGKHTFLEHEQQISYATFSLNGQFIGTASENIATVWSVTTGKKLTVLQGHQDVINHIAFSPDSQQVVTVSGEYWESWKRDSKERDREQEDNSARLWDVKTGKQLKILRTCEERANHAVFSPDGRYVVITSDDWTARLFDAKKGKHLFTFFHENDVRYAEFSPNGKYIVTASQDGTAGVWSVERLWDIGRLLRGQRGRLIAQLKGHKRRVTHAAFSSDSKRVITASGDNTARLWDIETGKQVGVLEHESVVNYAEFSPDDHYAVTASIDGFPRIWRVFPTTQDLIDTAHDIILQELTCEDLEIQAPFLGVIEHCCFVADENIQGIYQGQCKDGKAHGTGKSIGRNIYEGEFLEGHMHGQGIYTWLDGSRYEGVFENDEAPKIGSLPKDSWHEQGLALYNQGQLDEAVAAFEKHLKIIPEHEDAWNNLGIVLYKQGELDKAMNAFQKQIEIKPNHWDAWANKGILLYEQGKIDEAIVDFRKQVEVNPSHKTAWSYLGTTLLIQEKFDEAMDVFQKQAKLNPSHISELTNVGVKFFIQDKWDKATKLFDIGLDSQPDNLKLLSYDAELALLQNDIVRCQARITTGLSVVTSKDQEFAILPFIGWLAEPEEGWEDVIIAIRGLHSSVTFSWDVSMLRPAILRQDPVTQQVAHHFIDYFEGRIDRPGLERVLTTAKRSPSGIDAETEKELYKQATDLYVEGKKEEALTVFRKLVQAEPEHKKAWYSIGVILEGQGKVEEAIKAYEKQVEVDPVHKNAWKNLANLYKELGRLGDAEYASQRYEELK